MNKEVKWLNSAKFIAILAVVLDHTHGILYYDGRFAVATHFSVTLFIFIAGMTSYISDERRVESVAKIFVRSGKKIFIAYVFATFVYFVFKFGFFDFNSYLQYLIHFIMYYCIFS